MPGVWAAWGIGSLAVAWNYGLNQKQWPPPYAFLDLTLVMGICALIARWNGTIGGLLAWGLILPVLLIDLGRLDKGEGPLTVLPISKGAPSPAAQERAAGFTG